MDRVDALLARADARSPRACPLPVRRAHNALLRGGEVGVPDQDVLEQELRSYWPKQWAMLQYCLHIFSKMYIMFLRLKKYI